MGRCNNRRAQERAAQERNVSTRARFSKGPPSKKGGRGGRGRGGRGGGRDGRGRGGRNNDAVVEKIKTRVQQQRKDLGGISIVKSKTTTSTSGTNNRDANIASISRKSRHALDGIDVSKLDSITLSAESVKIVERLLRAYNVWEGDTEDEKKSDTYDNIDVGNNDKQKEEEDTSAQSEMEDMHPTSSEYTMTAANPDDDIDNYDDYGGDYEDEPDYQCRKDDITFNDVDVEDDHVINDNESYDDDDNSIDEDDRALDDEDTLIKSPIYRHLTTHFSFQQQEAVLALRASKKRLLMAKQNAKSEEGDINDDTDTIDDKMSKEDEGILLEMSMDWLSLHLKEKDLRRGFRVQKIVSSILGTPSERTLSNDALQIRAVPHSSISVMPKFTQSQYDKEVKERLVHLRKLNLTTDLIRMGFHSTEVETVFTSMNIDNLLISDSSDDGDFQPLSIFNGELLKHLIACVESDTKEVSLLDQEVAKEMEQAAVIERDQEKEVLEAIYAEGFQVLSNSSNESNDLHYKVEVKPTTPLTHPACNDKCHLHVITRGGYPLTTRPMLWFTNSTLPPTLLRRISINMNKHSQELVGQAAAVFDLMEYLAECISQWQKEFIDEEAVAEKISEDNVVSDDDDEIDYYSMTVEESKKLSRRQRQKYKAAQKSHARNTVLVERQRIKEEKDKARIEKTKLENSQVSSRMAEKVVNKRWKEWVENEGEKAYRKAMNDAFNAGADRDEARRVADIARKDMLIFHDALNEDEYKVEPADGKKSADVKEDIKSVTSDGSLSSTNAQLQKESNSSTAPHKTRSNEATPKTLLFVEKLRRMYEEKAKEKAAEISGETNSDLGTLHLTDLSSRSPADEADSTAEAMHVPAPVVAPSPGIETVLKDVLTTQQDQPWLISPEARVPTTVVNSRQTSPAEDARKHKISTALRVELEKKYKGEQPKGKGRQKYKNDNKHRGGDSNSNQFKQLLRTRQNLPAYKMRDKLVSTIKNNQVTVVSGDTGCGKTTQVPQLVLDDMIFNNRGAEANVIVTQPRRISAIGVSERIAAERSEKIGQTVGYSIRLDSKRSSKTRLLLCTTGVLLRRLQCDPDLAIVSHVFVDEVHGKSALVSLYHMISCVQYQVSDLLQRRKYLKLVLMSATLNAERFSAYFGGCPTVSIPGRAQPVQEYRLEDALQVTGHLVLEGSDCVAKKKSNGNDTDKLSKTQLRRLYPNTKYNKNVIDSLSIVDESITNYELIAELLQYICLNLEEGAILVFLSGMKEITTALEALTKVPFFQDSSNVVIYPLHSSLSNAEQTAIFNRPPPGKRKIVLSTNIAETSITIDDVVFVVDTARVKENRYDDLNKMPTLTECWASKAATKQRRGRAGRVKPGYCWHLYSKHTHDRVLADYQLPEMLRVGLEDLVLQILVLDLGEPANFLLKAVDKPTDMAIKNALNLLEALGASESDWSLTDTAKQNEESDIQVATSLTALGYHLATLPVHPRVGKLLIYGALFGCFEDILTIAAAMTSRNPFVSSFDNRDAADEAKRGFASDDHISVLLAFNQWSDLKRRDGRQAKQFLRENYLSYIALSNIIQLKKQLEKYMRDIGFFSSNQKGGSSTNQNDVQELHLIRAVIAAGLYPNIVIAPRSLSGKTAGEVSFRGQEVREIYLHPSTIAFTATELDSRYGCYHEIVKTSKVYIRDCTAVSKFALLLFGGSLKVYQTHGVAAVDDWLKFRVDAKSATLVKYLRSSMEALLLEKIMDPAIDVASSKRGKAVIEAVSSLLKMEGGK